MGGAWLKMPVHPGMPEVELASASAPSGWAYERWSPSKAQKHFEPVVFDRPDHTQFWGFTPVGADQSRAEEAMAKIGFGELPIELRHRIEREPGRAEELVAEFRQRNGRNGDEVA